MSEIKIHGCTYCDGAERPIAVCPHTNNRRVTADERDWESCVEPNCDNRVTRFLRGDFYCRKHANDFLRLA